MIHLEFYVDDYRKMYWFELEEEEAQKLISIYWGLTKRPKKFTTRDGIEVIVSPYKVDGHRINSYRKVEKWP